MARYKIVEKERGKFYVYKKGWLFWKCVNPIDYADWYLAHKYFMTYDEAYGLYVELDKFDQRKKVFILNNN